jgi:RNA polymerase sigma-70 factor, ECF subfamily
VWSDMRIADHKLKPSRSVQPSLHRYLLGLVGPLHSDDVAQEVLLVVCRKIGRLHTPELFRPWLYRVAGRAAFRYLKKERRSPEQVQDELAFAELPAPDASPPPELLQDLHKMDGISPASRAVLVLHFQEELSLPEIAAILETPLGKVKSRLAYGLTALRKKLGPERRV